MSPSNCNQSARGFFGAAVEELDQLIGDVMHFVESKDIAKDTLVFFTSDNGPWMQMKLAGGSAALFRGAKENTWEGWCECIFIGLQSFLIITDSKCLIVFVYSMCIKEEFVNQHGHIGRVCSLRICICCFNLDPLYQSAISIQLNHILGMIDAGSRSMEITATYDIFNTMLNIVDAPLPSDRVIDGKDMSNILFNLNGGHSQHDCIYIWGGTPNDTTCHVTPDDKDKDYRICQGLWAVRCGEYKAHWVTRDQNLSHSVQDPPLLYNVNHDPSELHPIWPNNVGYDRIMQRLTAAKWAHLETIDKVPNQVSLGFSRDNWFCGDPNSQEKYPQYPNCTMTPENWQAFTCNPVCLDFGNCGPSVLH